MKMNAVYTIVGVNRKHYRKMGQSKVLSDEVIELTYHPEDENSKRKLDGFLKIRLRKVCYQDEKNLYFEFLTNNFEISAEEVAFLCKMVNFFFQACRFFHSEN
jgi:hypothetical protein